MAAPKKLKNSVILFASIERDQHDELRTISFEKRRSIADLTREALKQYIATTKEIPIKKK